MSPQPQQGRPLGPAGIYAASPYVQQLMQEQQQEQQQQQQQRQREQQRRQQHQEQQQEQQSLLQPRFSPTPIPAAGSADVAGAVLFDDRPHLVARGDARVVELRVWASDRVHGLSLFYEQQQQPPASVSEGQPPPPRQLVEGPLIGRRAGRCQAVPLAFGESIVAVAGRFDGAQAPQVPSLAVLVVATQRLGGAEGHGQSQQYSFGGQGLPSANEGKEFVLRVPDRQRVVGFHGGLAPEGSGAGGICMLGAYTAPIAAVRQNRS
jgi:hypothetical protein